MAAPIITFPADGATLSYVRGTGFVPPLVITANQAATLIDLSGGDYGSVWYCSDADTDTFPVQLFDAEPDVGSGTLEAFLHSDDDGDGPTVTYNVNVTEPATGGVLIAAMGAAGGMQQLTGGMQRN